MTGTRKIRVAVVGLRFGRVWVAAYQVLPDVAEVAVCDSDTEVLQRIGDEFGIARRYTDLDAVLASDAYDAVHLVTPIPLHVEQAREFLTDRFYVYGDQMGFESAQVRGEDPVIFKVERRELKEGQRGRGVQTRWVRVPDLAELVPGEIVGAVRRSRITRGIPLAHAFVRSVIEAREPDIDLLTAANWTAAGICAHESAMQGGVAVSIPSFG